jgi:hypothetical protein
MSRFLNNTAVTKIRSIWSRFDMVECMDRIFAIRAPVWALLALIVSSGFWMIWHMNYGSVPVYETHNFFFGKIAFNRWIDPIFTAVVVLTGTALLRWAGEQITKQEIKEEGVRKGSSHILGRCMILSAAAMLYGGLMFIISGEPLYALLTILVSWCVGMVLFVGIVLFLDFVVDNGAWKRILFVSAPSSPVGDVQIFDREEVRAAASSMRRPPTNGDSDSVGTGSGLLDLTREGEAFDLVALEGHGLFGIIDTMSPRLDRYLIVHEVDSRTTCTLNTSTVANTGPTFEKPANARSTIVA